MEQTNNGFLSSFWQRNRMIFKGFTIAFLVLLLLIPTTFIQDLIRERQQRQSEAVAEVGSRWAGAQVVTGPVIRVPYRTTSMTADGKPAFVNGFAYFLPSKLQVNTEIVPEKRSRGIYSVIVYSTRIQMVGHIDSIKASDVSLLPENLLWNEASVHVNVTDVRGLKEEVKFNWQGSSMELVPGKISDQQFPDALGSVLALSPQSIASGGDFSCTLQLNGSENLMFTPVGKQTTVNVHSSWPNPSFTGNYLPDERKVSDSGFVATWKVLYLNRNFPQQWTDKTYNLAQSAFGLNLLIPVDAYQKSIRSVKYALLCIVLTFTAFLLIEMMYRRNVHFLQYALVGFALCLFYTLLVSISEYLLFNVAYVIASAATIALVAWYVRYLFRSVRIGMLVGVLLAAVYGFIFILIQSQDYALLMGSIGLFVTLAVIMYFSRRVNWERG